MHSLYSRVFFFLFCPLFPCFGADRRGGRERAGRKIPSVAAGRSDRAARNAWEGWETLQRIGSNKQWWYWCTVVTYGFNNFDAPRTKVCHPLAISTRQGLPRKSLRETPLTVTIFPSLGSFSLSRRRKMKKKTYLYSLLIPVSK